MKKIFLIAGFLILGFTSIAQVAIGKNTIDGSGILDFPTGTTKGIILPIVETLPTASAALNGTILMDKNDSKIKMCENGVWVSLTDTGSVSGVTFNATAEAGVSTIIGAQTTSASGVLVLESIDKALVLPKVSNPHTNVKSPTAGMMVYDTNSNSVAIYEGTKWNYWNADATNTIKFLFCADAETRGDLKVNAPVFASSLVPYSGGNSTTYATQTINSTGVSGLTATLDAGILEYGNGNLSFQITGTPTSSGTASFAITFGGISCTFTCVVAP